MKRLISLLLALSMIFVFLTACATDTNTNTTDDSTNQSTTDDTTTDDTTEDTTDTTDDTTDDTTEDTTGEIDRSETIKIGFTVSGFDNENFVYMDQLMAAYCEENNIDYVTIAHNSESSTLMEIMENFEAAGCDGIIFQNFEPESIQSTLDHLYEKGVKVISYDAEVENVTGSWICSNYATGQVIGQCAADFINNELGGVCDYIVMDSQVVFMQERVKGIMDTIAEQCPESTMVATQRILLPEAVDTFESMLTAHPDVQVLCTGYSTCATNIVAAWLPELERKGADLSKYGVFTCDCTNLDLEYMYETMTEGTNILRSTVDLGLKEFVPMGMIEQCEAAIRGFESEYPEGTTQTFPYEAVTFDNLEEVAAKYDVDLA